MKITIKLKKRPTGAVNMAYAKTPGKTTRARIIALIEPYTHVRPVLPQYAVGALVPDLDLLGADINDEFDFPAGKGYFSGEIEAKWTVDYLSAYTDLKLTKV